MVEPISTTIVTAFVVGVIFGVIDELSRKVSAIIWIVAIIFLGISFFIQGPAGYANSLNWGIWNWVVMLIFVNISYLLGKFGCKNLKESFK